MGSLLFLVWAGFLWGSKGQGGWCFPSWMGSLLVPVGSESEWESQSQVGIHPGSQRDPHVDNSVCSHKSRGKILHRGRGTAPNPGMALGMAGMGLGVWSRGSNPCLESLGMDGMGLRMLGRLQSMDAPGIGNVGGI